MPTAIMAPEISPPGRCAHRNSAPPAAPIASVSSTWRVLVRVGRADGHRCGDQAHAALWQIRAHGDKCANAIAAMRAVISLEDLALKRRGNRQANSAGVRSRARGKPEEASAATAHPSLPLARGRERSQRTRSLLGGSASFAASACIRRRNFLRSLPCSPLASASLEHSIEAALWTTGLALRSRRPKWPARWSRRTRSPSGTGMRCAVAADAGR